MISKLRKWWHKRQRQIDLDVLWPACKEKAPDLETAKAIFARHAFFDSAWDEFNDSELKSFIDSLN